MGRPFLPEVRSHPGFQKRNQFRLHEFVIVRNVEADRRRTDEKRRCAGLATATVFTC